MGLVFTLEERHFHLGYADPDFVFGGTFFIAWYLLFALGLGAAAALR